MAGQVGAHGGCEDNCVSSDRFDISSSEHIILDNVLDVLMTILLCSDWPMVALWKIVEIGRYEGVLCVSSDRRHSLPEDQAPDLLRMTGKRCAMAMAYLLWHLIIASVRRTRSLHTVRQVCTFH